MLFHGQEITIIVQQSVAMLDAKSADDDVGGLADRDAQTAQPALISGGPGSEMVVQKRHDRILAQGTFDARGLGLVAHALKDFQQDEIADQQGLPRRGNFQLLCLRRGAAL
jgi:hypothetical protein